MSKDGPRAVAVYVLIASSSLSSGEPSFLVVASRKHEGKYVFPKGGIEEGEDSREAAVREAWEEAGVNTDQLHLGALVKLNDSKPHIKSPTDSPLSPDFVPSTTYAYELFSVTSTRLDDALASDWPEKDERADRKWVKGWDALEEAVVWGRRSEINRNAIRLLKERLS